MKSLETINLGHNNITNEGIHRLKDGLLQNKSLLRIGLQSSKLSCEGNDMFMFIKANLAASRQQALFTFKVKV